MQNERGAALITVLFIALLVLSLAGSLILITNMTTTNAISATDEIQAYYAAEAGLQAALNVLRGNIAPHPNDGTTMNFKNAINIATSNNPSSGIAQFSRWLTYNYPTNSPDRVTLSPSYSPADGIAYAITGITDPDNSMQVIYSTAGGFNADALSTSASNVNLPGGVTLHYTPQSTTDITTNGNPALGNFRFSGVKNSTSIDFSSTVTTFTLQVTESAPLAFGSTSPISVAIKGTMRGTITSTSSIVYLDFNNQSIEIPNVGTMLVMPSTTLTLPVDGTVTTLQTAVAAGEPRRLVLKVRGYGPRGAIKNMQTMVSRLGASYDPPATLVIRGNDSNTASDIQIGSSAAYTYSGRDNANGQALPAFLVTNSPDYTTLTTLKSNNPSALQGDPSGLTPVLKQLTLPAELSSLPGFLQTTSDPVSGARAFVQQLRLSSQQTYYGCSTGRNSSCDRYFNTRAGDSQPAEYGTSTSNGLFTFVDGDAHLSNAGGRGLLVVTGTLYMDGGSQTFEGLVLVLGGGVIERSGGGNGTSLGAFVLAKFDSTSGFQTPRMNSSGSGTAGIQLDRNKLKGAFNLAPPYAMTVGEY